MNTTKNMQNNNFQKLVFADFISSLGSNMTAIAIMLIVYQKTQDIFITSLFVLVNLMPQVILTPFISKINFPWSFRRIFAVAEFLCAILLGTLLINDSLPIIFVLFSLFSVVFFILECYRAEYLKVISTKESIYKYQSISRTANIIVTLLGPLLAGWLMMTFGNKAIYAIDIITYVIAGLIIMTISPFEKPIIVKKARVEKKSSLMPTENTTLFLGTIIITLIGGTTSILTLSYIMETLRSSAMHYTILMSFMAFGSVLGNIVINLKFIKTRLKFVSIISTFLMGLLLMLVIFKPNFLAMLMILTISGFLSALVMIYYATEIYMRYNGDEIRVKYAYFQNSINLSTAASKPIGGLMSKEIGVMISLFVMGLVFILSIPLNGVIEKRRLVALDQDAT